ncbi:MAG: D-alanyl-D-alanine carboxypeptidase/D-alanyl-D-alanine-endopeptidase [Prevotellaceae bacterium]|jgi:D-alanyl-D-alanine carboxypeptidase/D-alanyl-D-alanine-endopeptidase (penicillin-binding protein 4)|nr:D-alanyl-D-alanine carboxypeptidase/D-alanyl-D-alanine-endopeptidase [Prevotellaceae bacterium]
MKKYIFPLLLSVLSSGLYAQNTFARFGNNALLQHANISLMVKDATGNAVVCRHGERNSMIPASTMKIVTTATALEILGGDFRFATAVEIDGNITREGVLEGNLIVKGAGDPTLGSDKIGDKAFMEKWIAAVKNAGITKIAGDIIVDPGIFDSEAVNPKWLWEDIGNYYASGVYGISYLDNTYQLVLRSGGAGTRPNIVKTVPELPGLVFENRLKSTDIAHDSAYIYGAPRSYSRTIQGAIPANRNNFIIKGDIPEPDILLAKNLQSALIRNHIPVTGNTSNVPPTTRNRRTIHLHRSPPLREIIREINVKSNNHFAEHLFLTLALQHHAVATVKDAVATVKRHWQTKGLPVDELFMCDGSGLSPANAVSANFLTELLLYMSTKSKYKDDFYRSLPLAGKEGTLASFLKNTRLDGRVRAKSGSMSRVCAYAGYLENDGKQYVFAVIVNNANGRSTDVRKKIEALLLDMQP